MTRVIRRDDPFSFYRGGDKPGFELREGFGQVAAPVAKADMARFVVYRSGKEQDAGFADKLLAESLDVFLGFEEGKTDGGGVRGSPLEKIGMAGEKGGKLPEVAKHDLQIAVDQFLAMTKGERG